jgi:transcription antitermination protein NusB
VADPSGTPALSSFERIRRMRARSWVLQILYLWEAQDERRPLEEVMEEVLATRRVSPPRIPLVRRHMKVLSENREEVDEAIRQAMENWRLDRLSRTDRAVLRLSVSELLFLQDVPAKVVLQEGVRLAGQYGGHDSSRFVNGVLDAVFRSRGRSD